MKPPEAYCGPARADVQEPQVGAGEVHAAHGAACETAQKLAELRQPVGVAGRVLDGQVGQRAPRSSPARCSSPARPVGHGQALVVDLDRAVDDHVARVLAQTGRLGEVADLEPQRLLGRAVRAGLEQQRVPAPPKCAGTCWVAMASTVAWISAMGWLGLNTIVFGPRSTGAAASAASVARGDAARRPPRWRPPVDRWLWRRGGLAYQGAWGDLSVHGHVGARIPAREEAPPLAPRTGHLLPARTKGTGLVARVDRDNPVSVFGFAGGRFTSPSARPVGSAGQAPDEPVAADRVMHRGISTPRPRSATTRSFTADTSDRVTSTTGRASDGRTNGSSSTGTRPRLAGAALLHVPQRVEHQPGEELGVARDGQRRRGRRTSASNPTVRCSRTGSNARSAAHCPAPTCAARVGHGPLPDGLDPDDHRTDRASAVIRGPRVATITSHRSSDTVTSTTVAILRALLRVGGSVDGGGERIRAEPTVPVPTTSEFPSTGVRSLRPRCWRRGRGDPRDGSPGGTAARRRLRWPATGRRTTRGSSPPHPARRRTRCTATELATRPRWSARSGRPPAGHLTAVDDLHAWLLARATGCRSAPPTRASRPRRDGRGVGSRRVQPGRRLVRAAQGLPRPVRHVPAAAARGPRPGRAHARRPQQHGPRAGRAERPGRVPRASVSREGLDDGRGSHGQGVHMGCDDRRAGPGLPVRRAAAGPADRLLRGVDVAAPPVPVHASSASRRTATTGSTTSGRAQTPSVTAVVLGPAGRSDLLEYFTLKSFVVGEHLTFPHGTGHRLAGVRRPRAPPTPWSPSVPSGAGSWR